ncbi:hypothetical protein NDU88_001198 [Pleurodeles waltl]|uniref:Uncharacterized protein n=1 Tax=Pleurodeles waltl TaxID=8319 RepID=A0AAV7PAG4_PLEWA|nr:hypothetical protein NDU88_001198 [Pleurodeles waltl]
MHCQSYDSCGKEGETGREPVSRGTPGTLRECWLVCVEVRDATAPGCSNHDMKLVEPRDGAHAEAMENRDGGESRDRNLPTPPEDSRMLTEPVWQPRKQSPA